MSCLGEGTCDHLNRLGIAYFGAEVGRISQNEINICYSQWLPGGTSNNLALSSAQILNEMLTF